ncbi:MAG: PAS domain S-box protein, partial [Rhizobacter sp.]
MLKLYTRRSLKAKLTFWSIAAIACVVLSVTSFALYVLRARLTHSAAEMQSSFVEGVARTLDARIADRRRALSQVAQVLGPLQLSRPADVQAHFDARPLVYNLFDAVFIAGPDGAVTFDARARGARVASSVADRPYFQEALTADRTVVSAPLLGKASAEPAIVFATRLRDASGRTTGVLGGIMYLSGANFLSELTRLRIGATGHVSLIAKGDQPVFVTHPERALILAPLPSPAQWPHAREALQGPVPTVEGPGLTGAASLFSYRSLVEVPWVLQGVYPTAEAHAELRATERGVVAIGAALMLAAGVLVWRLVGHLLRPLEQLRDAMRRSCNQPQALEVETPDQTRELFEVADAYNALMRHMGDARTALQRSEERLRLITDNLPAQILYIDADQRYRFVNGEVGRVLGVDPASLLGRTVSEVRGRRLYSHLQAHLATALCGTSVSFEGEQVEDGRTLWFQTTYVPDADEGGRVRGLFSMTVDITAQKEAELRRVASEERVVRILAHAPDAFIGIDPAGTINEWNRQAEVTFGWARDEVLGRRL